MPCQRSSSSHHDKRRFGASVSPLQNSSYFKIAFWNIQGLANLSNNNIIDSFDVCCLYETWSEREYSSLLPHSLKLRTGYWSPALRDKSRGRASGGLVTLFRPQLNSSLIECSPWWIFNRLTYGIHSIIIGSFYFSSSLDLPILIELLQQTLTDLLSRFENDLFILGGDFNCRVEILDTFSEGLLEGTALNLNRSSFDEVINAKGSCLNEFMQENSFILLNGRTYSDSPANILI